jgi:hypothetical protein
MTDETKKPEPTAEEAIETGGTFADQVSRMSTDQLHVVKQTVEAETSKRDEPNYAGMSDNEFREQVRKKHGFNPI